MKKLTLIIAFSLLPFLAKAEDSPDDTKPGTCTIYENADSKSTCVVMRMKGIRGVWLPLERSEILRKEHILLPEVQLQLEVSRKELQKALEAAELYKASLEERKKLNVLLEKELENARKSEAEAVNRANAWYRQPALWITVGLVIGVAGTVSVAI